MWWSINVCYILLETKPYSFFFKVSELPMKPLETFRSFEFTHANARIRARGK